MQFLIFALCFFVSLILVAALVRGSLFVTDWIADRSADACGISAAPAVRAYWFHKQTGRVFFWIAAPMSLLSVAIVATLRLICH
jgi:hypothetical protein